MTTDTIDTTTPDTPVEPDPMRILRISTTQSLSCRSQLTYHVGCNESGAIHFRLWANTAAGMFSNSWFSMADVSPLLSATDGITSTALQPLWQFSSRNNPGFAMALLQGEGLIEKSVLTPRTYRTVDPAPFLKSINALVASGVDLSEDDEPSDALPIAAPEAPKRGRLKKQSA